MKNILVIALALITILVTSGYGGYVGGYDSSHHGDYYHGGYGHDHHDDDWDDDHGSYGHDHHDDDGDDDHGGYGHDYHGGHGHEHNDDDGDDEHGDYGHDHHDDDKDDHHGGYGHDHHGDYSHKNYNKLKIKTTTAAAEVPMDDKPVKDNNAPSDVAPITSTGNNENDVTTQKSDAIINQTEMGTEQSAAAQSSVTASDGGSVRKARSEKKPVLKVLSKRSIDSDESGETEEDEDPESKEDR